MKASPGNVVACALVACLDKAGIEWVWFVPCLALSAAGVALMRLAGMHKMASIPIPQQSSSEVK